MGNICCENTANAGNITGTYPIKEMKFETVVGFQPNLSALVTDKLNEWGEESIHIDRSKHVKSIKMDPMKEPIKNFVYDGEWELGQPDGLGKIYFSNGEYFEGEFRDGEAFGPGRYIFSDGSTFVGNVENNKARGEGKYISKEVTFEGFWEASKPSVGTYTLTNGTKVELQSPHHGKIAFRNGDVYSGNISTELHPTGEGVMQFINGNTYEGDWRDGLMHGNGVFRWKNNGAEYDGGYEKGKKSGMGTFKYPDGKQYQGEWFNGHQQGAGKLIKNGETIFDGFFSEGQAVVSTKAASGRGKGLGVQHTESQFNAFRAGDMVEERPPESRINPEIPVVYKTGEIMIDHQPNLPEISSYVPKPKPIEESTFRMPPPPPPIINPGSHIESGYNVQQPFAGYQRSDELFRPVNEQQFGNNISNVANAAGNNGIRTESASAVNAVNHAGSSFNNPPVERPNSNPIAP